MKPRLKLVKAAPAKAPKKKDNISRVFEKARAMRVTIEFLMPTRTGRWKWTKETARFDTEAAARRFLRDTKAEWERFRRNQG